MYIKRYDVPLKNVVVIQIQIVHLHSFTSQAFFCIKLIMLDLGKLCVVFWSKIYIKQLKEILRYLCIILSVSLHSTIPFYLATYISKFHDISTLLCVYII